MNVLLALSGLCLALSTPIALFYDIEIGGYMLAAGGIAFTLCLFIHMALNNDKP